MRSQQVVYEDRICYLLRRQMPEHRDLRLNWRSPARRTTPEAERQGSHSAESFRRLKQQERQRSRLEKYQL